VIAAPENGVTEGVHADLYTHLTLSRHPLLRRSKACLFSVLPNWGTCTLPTTVL
jgi:hypothetical protein